MGIKAQIIWTTKLIWGIKNRKIMGSNIRTLTQAQTQTQTQMPTLTIKAPRVGNAITLCL